MSEAQDLPAPFMLKQAASPVNPIQRGHICPLCKDPIKLQLASRRAAVLCKSYKDWAVLMARMTAKDSGRNTHHVSHLCGVAMCVKPGHIVLTSSLARRTKGAEPVIPVIGRFAATIRGV